MGIAYYNDSEKFCCDVLRKNIERGRLPEGYVDGRSITELHATDFMGYQHVHLFAGIGGFPYGLQLAHFPAYIRVLTGGFPCQDISNAGKRAGIEGERSGLWKEMYRLIQEANDCQMGFDYILVENVAALLTRGLSTVLADLATVGMDAEWCVLRAADVGAPHRRERVFIVAYPSSSGQQERQSAGRIHNQSDSSDFLPNTNSDGQRIGAIQQGHQQECSEAANAGDDGTQEFMANACISRWQEFNTSTFTGEQRHAARRTSAPGTEGQSERGLGRVFDGLSFRLDQYRWPAGPGEQQHQWEPARVITHKQPHRRDRLKALGNAIVPQVVAEIGVQIIHHYALVRRGKGKL